MRFFLASFLFAAIVCMLSACGPKCTSGAMRCHGTCAQLCDKDGQWRNVQDCNNVKPKDLDWKCGCNENQSKCFCSPASKK